MKEGSDPLSTDMVTRQNDVKIKAQLILVAEQVDIHTMYNKDIIEICGHSEVDISSDHLSKLTNLANEITCQYEAAKNFGKKSTTYLTTFISKI